MTTQLNAQIKTALEEIKAQNVIELDVREQSDITDFLIIASGTSNRHVKSVANRVVEELKPQGVRPLGMEGLTDGEWVLVDYGDTVLHVMLPQARDFYELEKLWSKVPANRLREQGESAAEGKRSWCVWAIRCPAGWRRGGATITSACRGSSP